MIKVDKTVNVNLILNSRFVVAALHATCESKKHESTVSVPFAEQAKYLAVISGLRGEPIYSLRCELIFF
jgi:hypothetical protein